MEVAYPARAELAALDAALAAPQAAPQAASEVTATPSTKDKDSHTDEQQLIVADCAANLAQTQLAHDARSLQVGDACLFLFLICFTLHWQFDELTAKFALALNQVTISMRVDCLLKPFCD